jgi:hypothetical protein
MARRKRFIQAPPKFVSAEIIKAVGDMADMRACSLQKARPNDGLRSYEYNQLAHWLWNLAESMSDLAGGEKPHDCGEHVECPRCGAQDCHGECSGGEKP